MRHTELITALDTDSPELAISWASAIGACRWVKIGKQLFTSWGPDAVRRMKSLDKQVFLDLKFHDIPNTVASAAKAASSLGADFTTIHAFGGRNMISAARAAIDGSGLRILAVTILTSLDDQMLCEELGLHETASEAVPRLARMAIEAGAHGIVCSPLELTLVRDAIGPDPLVVTPGVRPSWAGKDDQARIMTPREAAIAGADYIVVGRPIYKHPVPAEAAQSIIQELKSI